MRCPHCKGTGEFISTKQTKLRALEIIELWGILRDKSNVELADLIKPIEDYLRDRDLVPAIFSFLDEIWWRLQIANDTIKETHIKIEKLSNDPEWLDKG